MCWISSVCPSISAFYQSYSALSFRGSSVWNEFPCFQLGLANREAPKGIKKVRSGVYFPVSFLLTLIQLYLSTEGHCTIMWSFPIALNSPFLYFFRNRNSVTAAAGPRALNYPLLASVSPVAAFWDMCKSFGTPPITQWNAGHSCLNLGWLGQLLISNKMKQNQYFLLRRPCERAVLLVPYFLRALDKI